MDKGRLFVNPGQVDGAFERFLTSAIATILTIIFSWRLLIENESGPLCIEDIPTRDADGDAIKKAENPDEDAQSEEVRQASGDACAADAVASGDTSVSVSSSRVNSGSVFVNSWPGSQYVVPTATGDPLQAARSITPQQLQAQLLKTEGLSRSLDAERESDLLWLSTETLTGKDNGLTVTPLHSDSDGSDEATRESDSASTDSDAGDIQIQDALVDSSSDSECCLMFNHFLEAITEESDVDSEKCATPRKSDGGHDSSGHVSDVSSIGTYTWDDTMVDETLPRRYGLVNTQRPLIIGHYVDRTSKFSTDTDHYIITAPTTMSGSPPDDHSALPSSVSAGQNVTTTSPSPAASGLELSLMERLAVLDKTDGSMSDTTSLEEGRVGSLDGYGASCLDWMSSTTGSVTEPGTPVRDLGAYQDSILDEVSAAPPGSESNTEVARTPSPGSVHSEPLVPRPTIESHVLECRAQQEQQPLSSSLAGGGQSPADAITPQVDSTDGSQTCNPRLPTNESSYGSPSQADQTITGVSKPMGPPPEQTRDVQGSIDPNPITGARTLHIEGRPMLIESRHVNIHSSLARLDISGQTNTDTNHLFSGTAKQYKSELFLSPGTEYPSRIPGSDVTDVTATAPQVAYLPYTGDYTDAGDRVERSIPIDNGAVSVLEITPERDGGSHGSHGSALRPTSLPHSQLDHHKLYRNEINITSSNRTRTDGDIERTNKDGWREVLVTTSPTYVDCQLSTVQEPPPRGFTFVRTTDVHTDYKVCDSHAQWQESTGDKTGLLSDKRHEARAAMGQTQASPGTLVNQPNYSENQWPVTPGAAPGTCKPLHYPCKHGPAAAGDIPEHGAQPNGALCNLSPPRIKVAPGAVASVSYSGLRSNGAGISQVKPGTETGKLAQGIATQPRSRQPIHQRDMAEIYDESYDMARRQGYVSPLEQRGERATSPRRVGAVEALALSQARNQQKPGRPLLNPSRPGSWGGTDGNQTPTSDRGRPASGAAGATSPTECPPRPPDRSYSYNRTAQLQNAVSNSPYNMFSRLERHSAGRPNINGNNQLSHSKTPAYSPGSTSAQSGPRNCTALATSTALARKDYYSEIAGDPYLVAEAPRPIISAVASAEATGENPYVAVARATARAASVASANAAAGAASLPDSSIPITDSSAARAPPQHPDNDISVVISTSCRIRNDDPARIISESRDALDALGYETKHQVSHQAGAAGPALPNAKPNKAIESPVKRIVTAGDGAPSEGPQRMTITIQHARRQSLENLQQTIDVELPERHQSGDLTSMISDAVKRVLASQAGPASDSPVVQRAIDRVTRQVLQAYSSDTETEDTPDLSRKQGPGTREASQGGKPSLVTDPPPVPPVTHATTHYSQHSTTQDKVLTSIYVTGTHPNVAAGAVADEVVLKVVADADNQPSVEHVLLSGSESAASTPLVTRKGPVMKPATVGAMQGQTNLYTSGQRIREPARDYQHPNMDYTSTYHPRPGTSALSRSQLSEQRHQTQHAVDSHPPGSGARPRSTNMAEYPQYLQHKPHVPTGLQSPQGVPGVMETDLDAALSASAPDPGGAMYASDKFQYISQSSMMETDLDEYDSMAYTVHVERRSDDTVSESSDNYIDKDVPASRPTMTPSSTTSRTVSSQPAGRPPVNTQAHYTGKLAREDGQPRSSYPPPIKASHYLIANNEPRRQEPPVSPVHEPAKKGILKNSNDNIHALAESKQGPASSVSLTNGDLNSKAQGPSVSPGSTSRSLSSPVRALPSDTDAKQVHSKPPTGQTRTNNVLVRPYQPKLTSTEPRTPKPYESVLLKGYEDKQTPFHIRKQFEDPEKNTPSSRLKINDSRQEFLDKTEKKPVVYPKTISLYDQEFELRKKKWDNMASPTKPKSMMLVDIDIENKQDKNKKSQALAKSTEDIKKKLDSIRLKAPSSFAERSWPKIQLQTYKSHDRALNSMHMYGNLSRKSSTSSIGSNEDSNIRKAKSMGTLPGQFFSDRRSYTSLIETNMDTMQSSQTPLVLETDLDDDLPIRTKSVTNLTANKVTTAGQPHDDHHKHRSLEMINYTYMQEDQANMQNGEARQYGSEHELRIAQSLNKLSLPDWYRSSIRKSREKLNIRKTRPSDLPFSLSNEERSRSSSRSQSPGGRPVVIRHRVSSATYTRTSNPSTPTSPDANSSFELPSAKLKGSDIDLKSMKIHSVDNIPVPLSRNDPGRESARDQYLKIKAQSLSANSSVRGSQEYIETTFDGGSETVSTQNVSSLRMQETVMTQDGRYITQTYVALDNDENGTVRNGIQNGDGRKFSDGSGRSEDSANASLDSSGRDLTHAELSKHIFAVGKECSTLVQKLSSDFPDDSGIEVNNPDEVYVRMMNNLESSHKDIQERARLISAEEQQRYDYRDPNQQRQGQEPDRRSFPVLSPVRNDNTYTWPEDMEAVGEPVKVTMTTTPTRKEPMLAPGERLRDKHSLDEVLDGLLAIPPPRSPASPGSSKSPDYEDAVSSSPKSQAMRLLKQAHTPQSSMTSVVSSREEEDYDTANEDSSDVNEETVIVSCRNPQCKASASLKEARKYYKTCHNCYSYYCSRDCRKAHWERHKERCMYSRINSACKHVIKRIHDSPELSEQFTKIARTGYLSRGRGCVILAFATHVKAIDFLNYGMRGLERPPGFANIRELETENVFGNQLSELIDMCRNYNPEVKFVIEVAIVAVEEHPKRALPRRDGPVIKKCAKLRLSRAQSASKRNQPETLILTAVPGSEFTENMEERKAREVCFINIQRKLRERGVSLRHHFPDVYRKLCAYVADNEHFTPITLYPIDGSSGKRFMCLIMPNAEPEVEWMYEPDLLEELGLHTEV